MLARIQQVWVLSLFAVAAALACWLAQSGSPPWIAAATALLVLNLHAFALAGEFTWLRRIPPGANVPRPSARTLVVAWWGEVITGLRVFGWRQPFRAHAYEDNLTDVQGRRAVLLVHGFVCNRALWNPWMARLRSTGTPYMAINLEPVFGSIDDYASLIETAVQRLETATGMLPIVVAHSMGGLAVRAWLQLHDGSQRVRSIVTIATPHAGTWLAHFGISENTRQMRHGNPWLRALEAGESERERALFTCYFGHCDNIVFPASNATLPGAVNHHIPGVAHVHMAFHPPILNDVLQRLRE